MKQSALEGINDIKIKEYAINKRSSWNILKHLWKLGKSFATYKT